MFELNGTIAIFILSFLLFMVALDALFLKPVGEAIEKRDARIAEDNQTALECRATADSKIAKYEKSLAEIREEAQKIITEAVSEAQKERSAQIEEVATEGRRKMEAAKENLRQERTSLIASLVDEEQMLVQEIVSKVLGSATSVAIDAGSIEKALKEAG